MLLRRALTHRLPRAAAPGAALLTPSLRRHWSTTVPGAMSDPAVEAAADVAVVYVTAPSADVAKTIATHLVNDRLAACVNIVPGITSVYRWQGKVESEAEVLMLIKARRAALPALTAAVKQAHPYDEPEVLAVPSVGGSETYLKWVLAETDGKSI